MKFHITKNKKLGSKKAFAILRKQVLKKPDSLIALAAGKTTDGLHGLIAMDAKKFPKKWKRIKILQIDENLGISPDLPGSFNFELRKELKPLFKILPSKNLFLIAGLKNPNKTIKEAYRFIKQNKGIDLITLGIGPAYDPHIAYNTIGESSLKSKMRVIRRIVACNDPTMGITLGIKDILDAKKVLLIAYGKEKAKSIDLAFNKKVNVKRVPASALQLHKDLTIVMDKDSARLLYRVK